MDRVVIIALIATTGTWAVTALGASTVILFKKTNQKILNLMLGFAAGVMIAASFWSLLQPAIDKAEIYLKTPAFLIVSIGFLSGAVFMWISDKIVVYATKKVSANEKSPTDRLNRIILLVLSITLHNIPEGLAVGVAFGALNQSSTTPETFTGAVSIAIGIGLQNFPEGAAVSLPLRREGCSRLKSFLIGQASGLVEPISGVIGALSVVYIQSLLPFALSFAAGAMILVAVHELIPECQQNKKANPYFATMGIVFGFTVMMLMDVALS